jgi:sodium/potassium-transporting ATPase subunit alpha
LLIKGAPDVLIGRCTHFTDEAGKTRTLTPDIRKKVEEIKDYWSSQGKRVILQARKVISKQNLQQSLSSKAVESEVLDHATSGLTLVGLVGIVDPPREEIPEVVRILRGAGIRIFMVGFPFRYTETLWRLSHS